MRADAAVLDDAPPKVIVAVIGLDQHEVGSLTVARLLSSAGMEVVYLGRFNTPATVSAVALQEDVDVVGISCHSWEFVEFSQDLLDLLMPHGIPVVFGGSVITAADEAVLRKQGVAALFGSSSSDQEIIDGIRGCATIRREALAR